VSEGKEGGRESKKLECVLGGEWLKKLSDFVSWGTGVYC
jgi:hypothetical protein